MRQSAPQHVLEQRRASDWRDCVLHNTHTQTHAQPQASLSAATPGRILPAVHISESHIHTCTHVCTHTLEQLQGGTSTSAHMAHFVRSIKLGCKRRCVSTACANMVRTQLIPYSVCAEAGGRHTNDGGCAGSSGCNHSVQEPAQKQSLSEGGEGRKKGEGKYFLLPVAKLGNSKTPMGPFHTIVFAVPTTAANLCNNEERKEGKMK